VVGRARDLGEVTPELRRTLDAFMASADPAGPWFVGLALRRFDGRIHELGLTEVWRTVLGELRPNTRRAAHAYLEIWSAGPPTGADVETLVSDTELLAKLGLEQFFRFLWRVSQRTELELGSEARSLLRKWRSVYSDSDRILELDQERR
jgi:hypothetical protein